MLFSKFSHPSGLVGRLVSAPLLNKGNAGLNQVTFDSTGSQS
jgi:hypothetical protein